MDSSISGSSSAPRSWHHPQHAAGHYRSVPSDVINGSNSISSSDSDSNKAGVRNSHNRSRFKEATRLPRLPEHPRDYFVSLPPPWHEHPRQPQEYAHSSASSSSDAYDSRSSPSPPYHMSHYARYEEHRPVVHQRVGPLHRMAGMEDTLQPVRPVATERGQDTENQMPPKADSGEILAKGKALCGYRLHY